MTLPLHLPKPNPAIICVREPPSCGNNFRLAVLLTGCRSQSSAQFLSGDQEPWAFRGGLAGEFQVSNALNSPQCVIMSVKRKRNQVLLCICWSESIWSV